MFQSAVSQERKYIPICNYFVPHCDFKCRGFCYLLFYCYIPFLLRRQSWGPRIDLHDPRFLALAAEHRLLQVEYEDYAAANSSGIACCRAVALIVSYPLPL